MAECRVTRTRASGPGGQHRNKVETAIVIEHKPSGVRGEASEERSQARNQAVALQRLRLNLALEVRAEASQAPSELWKSRKRGSRIEVSEKHFDFATLVAEAFDVLTAVKFDHRAAADKLGTSMTQLSRFLRKVPQVFQALNARRDELGLHPLR